MWTGGAAGGTRLRCQGSQRRGRQKREDLKGREKGCGSVCTPEGPGELFFSSSFEKERVEGTWAPAAGEALRLKTRFIASNFQYNNCLGKWIFTKRMKMKYPQHLFPGLLSSVILTHAYIGNSETWGSVPLMLWKFDTRSKRWTACEGSVSFQLIQASAELERRQKRPLPVQSSSRRRLSCLGSVRMCVRVWAWQNGVHSLS